MKTRSLAQKLLLCLLAGLVAGAGFLRIGNRFLAAFLPLPVVLGFAVFILVSSLVFAFVWQRREQQHKIDPSKTFAFWIGLMRYCIAFDLSMFGFQKFFHLQFITPLGMLDEPFSSFSGEWLTWSYFGHSYAFVCVIGFLQIAGSLLLVFNRTRLLGLMVILPVLLNIVLIDIFYGLAPGVLAHAIFMLAAAIYLLLLDYERLTALYLHVQNEETNAPISNTKLKTILSISILFLPLLLIAVNESPNKNPGLKGKYTVAELSINGKPIKPSACQDSVLTVVYFDLANDCVFEFNGVKKRMYGTYSLDESNDSLEVTWHYPLTSKDKFTGRLENIGNGPGIVGMIGKDSMSVKLKKFGE